MTNNAETMSTTDVTDISPKYPELLKQYEEIGGQIDKMEMNLDSEFSNLVAGIDQEIKTEELNKTEKDQLYIDELKQLKVLVNQLEKQYNEIKKQIEAGKAKQTGPVTKIEADASQSDINTALATVDTKNLTNETIPSTKKKQPPTTRNKLDIVPDPKKAKELTEATTALDKAKNEYEQANNALFTHLDKITTAKDDLADLQVTQDLLESDIQLLEIAKENAVSEKNTEQTLSVTKDLAAKTSELATTKEAVATKEQDIRDLEGQTNSLEQTVVDKKQSLDNNQATYDTAFQAEQIDVNTQTNTVLDGIKETLNTTISSTTTAIWEYNTKIDTWRSQIASSQDYDQISEQIATITTTEGNRKDQLDSLLSTLDQDASVRIQMIDKRTVGLQNTLQSLGGSDGKGGRIVQVNTNIAKLTTDISTVGSEIADIDKKIAGITIQDNEPIAEQLSKTNQLLALNTSKEQATRKKTLLEAQKSNNEALLSTISGEYDRALANANYLEATKQFVLAQHTQRSAEINRRQALFTYNRQVLWRKTLEDQIKKIEENIIKKEGENNDINGNDTTSLTNKRTLLKQIQGLEKTKNEMNVKLKTTLNIQGEVTAKHNALEIANNTLASKKVQLDQATANSKKTIELPTDLHEVITPSYEKLFGSQ